MGIVTVHPSTIAQMAQRSFWRELCPDLTVTDLPFGNVPDARVDADEIERERELQTAEGHLRFEAIADLEIIARLAHAVDVLVEHGIPTPFLFVYDEVWQIVASLQDHITALVGPDFLIGGDMWVWNVPIGSTGRGWAPHRDDQFADRSFAHDGAPNLVSLWLSLTDADVHNGCMYVLPRTADPHLPAEPKRADIPASALASIRAQPVPAGSVLSWTSDVLHWGSQSTPRASHARKSLCLYAQRGDVAPFTTDMVPTTGSLPLGYRLGFIARTMIRYRESKLHRELGLSPELRAFCDEHEVRLQKWLELMRRLGQR